MIMAVAVAVSMVYEALFLPDDMRKAKPKPIAFIISVIILLAGVFISIQQIIPEKTSFLVSSDSISLSAVPEAVFDAITSPGDYFAGLFGYNNAIFVTALIFIFYVYLFRKTGLFVLFFTGVCALSLFSDLVYFSTEIRHQVPLYLLMLMMFWMDEQVGTDSKGKRFKRIYDFSGSLTEHKDKFFIFLLLLQALMAYPAIKDDIAHPYSPSKELAGIIHSDHTLRDAIIIGAPEGNLESLPYYLDNPLYIYTEGMFSGYRHMITAGKDSATLIGLLKTAEHLHEVHHKPVIILLGNQIRPEGPYQFEFTHRAKIFTYTRTDLSLFYLKTTFLARFEDSITDEKYAVYLLN
jgi:hypothetical protein